jgi:hypothetical protein
MVCLAAGTILSVGATPFAGLEGLFVGAGEEPVVQGEMSLAVLRLAGGRVVGGNERAVCGFWRDFL